MRAFTAIVLSVLVHAALAACLAVFLSHSPAPEGKVSLDLSSIELSFSESPSENAVPRPEPPPSAPSTPAPRPELPPPAVAGIPWTAPAPSVPSLSVPSVLSVPPVLSTHPALAPRQARVDAPPRPCRAIRPDYPHISRLRGEEGTVVVELSVDESGVVTAAHVAVSSGFAALDEAALKAVRTARFSPATSAGHPIPAQARLTLTFRLN